MLPLLAGAFLAGLAGSVHCLAMCGPFAASCARVAGGLPAWHLGRVLTYTALGAVAGAFGRILPGPAWLPATLATALLVWFALGLAGLVPEPRLVPHRFANLAARSAARPALGAQFLFGMANGLLPCGLVYSALSFPVTLADPLRGAAAMAAFGTGTLPALSAAALGFRRLLVRNPRTRRAFALFILAAGLWTIWTRTSSEMAQSHHPPGHHLPSP